MKQKIGGLWNRMAWAKCESPSPKSPEEQELGE
jgi:hypothetical protein